MSFSIAQEPDGRMVYRTMLRMVAADGTVVAEPGDEIVPLPDGTLGKPPEKKRLVVAQTYRERKGFYVGRCVKVREIYGLQARCDVTVYALHVRAAMSGGVSPTCRRHVTLALSTLQSSRFTLVHDERARPGIDYPSE